MPDRAPYRPRRGAPFAFTPLTMTWAEVAASVFRVTESWLRDHLAEYPDFPAVDPKLDVFSTEAVTQWVRRRFGLVADPAATDDAERRLIERVHAKSERTLSRRTAA